MGKIGKKASTDLKSLLSYKIKRASSSVETFAFSGLIDSVLLNASTSHIETHYHSYFYKHIPAIIECLTNIAEQADSDKIEVLSNRNIFLQLADKLTKRMMVEEKDLFPTIKSMSDAIDNHKPYNPKFGSIKDTIVRIDGLGVNYLEHTELIINTYKNIFKNESSQLIQETMGALAEFKRTLNMYLNVSGDVIFPASLEMEASLED